MDRRRVLELCLLLAGGYAAIVGGLYLLQDRMIFPRSATAPPRRELPARAKHWSLETADGATIEGLHLASADPAAPMVLGFAGNAWNAQDFAVFLSDCLSDAAITTFHYRGYPPSDGHPSEAALADDARTIVDAIAQRWPNRPLVLVGVSIGSGVAAHVLAAPNVTGAVLIVPFDSLLAVARGQYPWAPVGKLLRHPFDTASHLDGLDRPVAILSAAEDQLIKPVRTDALIARVSNLVYEHRFEGVDHQSIFDAPTFPPILAKAVDAVIEAA